MIYLFLPFNHLMRGISLWYVHFDSVPMTYLPTSFATWATVIQITTQGQTEQMLLLAAANSYRTSASLPYLFCESELKGAQTSCSRHLSDLDLTVANLPSFMNLPLNASLTTNYNNDKTEPGASMFCSPCPERNLRTDSSENPEYTKYILKSAKSTSGDEIRSSIHTSLALLPVCEL